VEISDKGKGIADVAQAMQPFYTSHPEQERSGMGFAVMQTFMDDVEVTSTLGLGTVVRMRKTIAAARHE
jgi:stage II sporulation protein AB (anti-sigma F factor)